MISSLPIKVVPFHTTLNIHTCLCLEEAKSERLIKYITYTRITDILVDVQITEYNIPKYLLWRVAVLFLQTMAEKGFHLNIRT